MLYKSCSAFTIHPVLTQINSTHIVVLRFLLSNNYVLFIKACHCFMERCNEAFKDFEYLLKVAKALYLILF